VVPTNIVRSRSLVERLLRRANALALDINLKIICPLLSPPVSHSGTVLLLSLNVHF